MPKFQAWMERIAQTPGLHDVQSREWISNLWTLSERNELLICQICER